MPRLPAISAPRTSAARVQKRRGREGQQDSRSLQLPGFSVAVGEMAAAVRRAGGEAAYARIRWEPDLPIQQIISGWPQALHARRAEALGFAADSGIDEAILAFIEDDLEMQKQLV